MKLLHPLCTQIQNITLTHGLIAQINENASLRAVPVYLKAIERLWEAPPAGIVLGTNEMDFTGSFTMSPFRETIKNV